MRQGQRLWAARFVAQLSRGAVADALRVNVSSVVMWEQGAVPTPDRRAALADLYGVPADALFAELAARQADARDLLRPA